MVKTKRRHDQPGLRQLSIFLQNRVGELADLLRHFEADSVHVHGICVSDSADYAVIRIVVDRTDQARKIIHELGVACSERLILGVEIPDDPKALLQLSRALIGAELNIHNIYPMVTRPTGRPAVLVHVDDIGTAVDALAKREFELIFESDLILDGEEDEARF
ncbi:MAG: acetolactate synthase [Planctomycetota bacterium]